MRGGDATVLGYTFSAFPTPSSGRAPLFKRIAEFLAEYLRINAIKRMLDVVEVHRNEVIGLVLFAVVFAAFEGVGIALLLPVLQYAEGGNTAIAASSGAIWTVLNTLLHVLRLEPTLPVLLLLAFTPILLRQVVFFLNVWYSTLVSSRIGIRLQMRTLDTILDADPEFFTRNPVGKIVGVLFGQTNAAGAAVLAVIREVSVVLLIALYVAILLAISVPLTAMTIAFAVLVSVVIRANINKIRDYAVKAANLSQGMMGGIVERLSLIRLIKLRDQKRHESQKIREYALVMQDISIKQAKLGAGIEVTADPLLMLSVFVTLYVGITFLGMTLAQLGLLIFVLTRLNAKVKEFNGVRQQISANMAGLILVKNMSVDAVRSNTIRGGSLNFEGLTSEIVLDGVGFEYPDSYDSDGNATAQGKTVLRDVSVTIPAGSLTALVGRSGAGKSTLVELLPRLRDATAGSISFDGTDIREFQVGSLRKGIGYLTQSAMLFNDTVRANLLYGLDFEPSEEQIRSALEQAYASFIYDLPEGLETVLGDQGVRFSGGERQRIALARVLLEDSSILVLDEPTSSLDSESEAYIQKALAKLHGKKTIIVIAHRLATIFQADQLLVIEDGRIAERGTHAELVAAEGAYHRLFQTQLLS
jgi:ATP-binding cassette, subfamily B, bacterial MsbA